MAPFKLSDKLKEMTESLSNSSVLSGAFTNPFISAFIISFIILLIYYYNIGQDAVSNLFISSLVTTIFMYYTHFILKRQYGNVATKEIAIGGFEELDEVESTDKDE